MGEVEAPLDLDGLAESAKNATPGPWTHYVDELRPGHKVVVNEVQVADEPPIVQWAGFDDSSRPKREHTANAAFIAAANPSTVLRLVDLARLGEAARTFVEDHDAGRLGTGAIWCDGKCQPLAAMRRALAAKLRER